MSGVRAGAVVVGGGAGTRFGDSGLPKQFRPLRGRPVAVRATEAMLAHPAVEAAVLVLPAAEFDRWRTLVAPYFVGDRAPVRFVAGGATRQESSRRGLKALEETMGGGAAGDDLVLVHDAARPAASVDLVARVMEAAAVHGAAIPARPALDTLWELTPDGAAGAVVDRERTVAAQTPQAFRRGRLRRSLERAEAAGFTGTDEASAVRFAGHRVRVVEGSGDNLKITTPADLARLEGPVAAAPRIGHGFDAHRYGREGTLRLGGVEFPGTEALAGHSDGDALLHALADAILGAAAAPDIGSLFPSSDPDLRDADSRRFVVRAVEIAASAGFRPGQADLTVVAARPRLAPRRDEVRGRVADLLGLPVDAVGLKATTTDGMGFTGRGEGLAAIAVVRLDPAP